MAREDNETLKTITQRLDHPPLIHHGLRRFKDIALLQPAHFAVLPLNATTYVQFHSGDMQELVLSYSQYERLVGTHMRIVQAIMVVQGQASSAAVVVSWDRMRASGQC